MSSGCSYSDSWSRCSSEDIPLSPAQIALLQNLDAQTPPIWWMCYTWMHTLARETAAKQDADAAKGLLTVPTPQWPSRFSVSSPTRLYIHQTTRPSFHGNSQTQKPPTARQVQSWMMCPFHHQQCMVYLTYLNVNTFVYILWKSFVKWRTLYVAPAPPWPFSAGSWSGVPCWSVILPLQSTTLYK